jgi:hypothetical protein
LIVSDHGSSRAIDCQLKLEEKRNWESLKDKPVGVCYFYFKYDSKDAADQDDQLVARSILKQLAYKLLYKNRLSGSTSFDGIIDLYSKAKSGNRLNEDTAILELIRSCSNDFSSVFVFLDGLDECKDKHQSKIVNLIGELCSSIMRFCLTSQPQLNARVKELNNVVRLEISANETDIKMYVRKRLDDHKPAIHNDHKETIYNKLTVVSVADGM